MMLNYSKWIDHDFRHVAIVLKYSWNLKKIILETAGAVSTYVSAS